MAVAARHCMAAAKLPLPGSELSLVFLLAQVTPCRSVAALECSDCRPLMVMLCRIKAAIPLNACRHSKHDFPCMMLPSGAAAVKPHSRKSQLKGSMVASKAQSPLNVSLEITEAHQEEHSSL